MCSSPTEMENTSKTFQGRLSAGVNQYSSSEVKELTVKRDQIKAWKHWECCCPCFMDGTAESEKGGSHRIAVLGAARKLLHHKPASQIQNISSVKQQWPSSRQCTRKPGDRCIFQGEITKKTIGKLDLSKDNFDSVLQLWLGAGIFFNSAPLIERSGSSDLSLLETQHWIVIFYFWDKLLCKGGKSAPSTQEHLSDSSSTTENTRQVLR